MTYSKLFMTCSQLVHNLFKRVHDLFTFCSQLFHKFLLTTYSWLVLELFITCWQLIHKFFTNVSQLVHDLFTTCSQVFRSFVQNLFITSSWLVQTFPIGWQLINDFFMTCLQPFRNCFRASSWLFYLCTISLGLAHNFIITWSPFVHILPMTCLRLVHNFFTIFSKLVF